MAGVVVVDIQEDQFETVGKLLMQYDETANGGTDPDGQNWGMAGKIAANLS